MRWKPSTPCRSCSTTASKRGSRQHAAPGAALAAALVVTALGFASNAPVAHAQAIELSVESGGGFLTAALTFRWNRSEELIASLRRGLESRITFTTRLYEARPPAFSFAGDRVLAEKRVTRSAFWDFLEQVFVVEEEGGGQKSYTEPSALLHGFFSLDQTFAYASSKGSAGRSRYVAARAQFEPVRLMPPLTLVGLVGAAVSVTTPWVRREVP